MITEKGQDILQRFVSFAGEKILVTDNDSTVMTGEIIDTLAEILGKNAQKKIEEITNIQMNGGSRWTFKESLEMRVNILIQEKFSEKHIQECIEKMKFSEGFENLIQKILDEKKTLKNNIFILSGGFEEVILGKIHYLQIPASEKNIFSEQVFANKFLYSKNSEISGIDFSEFKNKMWTETAKRDKVLWLEKTQKILVTQKILAVGDGSNDIGILPSEERGLFVAFTGTVARENTIQKAHGVCAQNFQEISDLMF